MSSLEREPSTLSSGRKHDNIIYHQETFTSTPLIKTSLVFFTVLTVVAGTANTCLTKYQNRQFVTYSQECYDRTAPERREPPPGWWDEKVNGEWSCYNYFRCPMFQTFLMYLGEWLCQWIWIGSLIYKKNTNLDTIPSVDLSSHKLSIIKPHCPFYFWIIPTILDWFGSWLIHVAFTFSFASAIQLLRNFNIIVYGVVTVFFYKTAIRIRHLIGFSFVLVGLVFTSVFLLLVPDPTTSLQNADYIFLAIIMTLISTTLHTIQFIFEERLLRKYFCSPFEAVGWMGLFGSLFTIFFLLITEYGVPYGEHTSKTFYVIFNNSNILLPQIFYIFSVFVFNLCGIIVTKLVSSGYRNILAATRGALVWIFEIVSSWAPFDPFSFFGMLFLTSGATMYQSHIIWNPCPNLGAFCNHPQMCCAFLADPDLETDKSDVSDWIRPI